MYIPATALLLVRVHIYSLLLQHSGIHIVRYVPDLCYYHIIYDMYTAAKQLVETHAIKDFDRSEESPSCVSLARHI